MTEKQGEFLTLGEAAKRYRVSRYKLTALIAEGKLPTFQNELDRREKFVRVRDLERLAQPRATQPEGQ
jgi:hypothetical protein